MLLLSLLKKKKKKSSAQQLIYINKTLVLNLLQFSTTTVATPNRNRPGSSSYNPLIVEHLITTLGFSRDKAISISTALPPSTSPSPALLNSVPQFLKHSAGFSDTQIRSLISKQPRSLLSKIDKTLKPKFHYLHQQLGFSTSFLAPLLISNPAILFRSLHNFLIPTINFLKSSCLLHSNENLVKALKKSSWILSPGHKHVIASNIDILRQSGVSNQKISNIFIKHPRFFTQKPEWLQGILARVEKFGIDKESGLFVYAILALSSMSKDTVNNKFEIYKSYGWSESDICYAFRKYPNFLMFSEQKVRATMSFLLVELQYDPQVIVLKPKLLSYSLEKRLKPRNKVLKILTSKKLFKRDLYLTSVIDMSEKKFYENYVAKFVGEVPALKKTYEISNI